MRLEGILSWVKMKTPVMIYGKPLKQDLEEGSWAWLPLKKPKRDSKRKPKWEVWSDNIQTELHKMGTRPIKKLSEIKVLWEKPISRDRAEVERDALLGTWPSAAENPELLKA